jgi:hypothetical protein
MSSTSQQSVRDLLSGAAISEDRQLLWMLYGLVAVDVASAAYLSLFPLDTGFLYFIVGIMFGASAFIGVGAARFRRHYSPAGILWFLATIGAFQAWNVVVMWVSLLTRWWAHNQPGYHIAAGAAIGLIPLLVGISLLARKLRRTP